MCFGAFVHVCECVHVCVCTGVCRCGRDSTVGGDEHHKDNIRHRERFAVGLHGASAAEISVAARPNPGPIINHEHRIVLHTLKIGTRIKPRKLSCV